MAQSACAVVNTQRADGYVRRRPEESVLYQTVAKHWPALREELEEAGGLPRFVVREFEEYLRCGILEEGCLYLVCRQCGLSQVVALSCKTRGFCPGCLGRRMADTAVHLERYVLPAVPIRHWICSLPWGLRALLGYDRTLCAEVVSAFVGEISRSLCFRAKQALGLRSVADAHTGAVAAIQRTDSALRLNVHAHVLVLDGVYVRDEKTDTLVFYPLPTPTRAEVAAVARRTAERIEKLLRAHGRSLDPEMQDDQAAEPELCQNEPALAACYAAAARGAAVKSGQATLRLIVSRELTRAATDSPEAGAPDEPVAEVRGVNVHAKQLVDGRDRKQLERLCRYITRPPLSQDRVELRPDGRIELTLKSVWRDGTRAVVFEPRDFLVRLIAAIPPPKFHLLRYFGILSSHSALRAEVVPVPAHDPTLRRPPPAEGDQLELFANDETPPPRKRWAWLLRHVFRADLDTCPKCGGPMRWVEAAATRTASERLLSKLGLAPQPPPAPCCDPPGQLQLPFFR